MNLAIAGHSLQRLCVNAEQLCCFIAVQEWLEDEFMSGPGWLGDGANLDGWDADINGLLSQVTIQVDSAIPGDVL